jgi:SIR2-like domain
MSLRAPAPLLCIARTTIPKVAGPQGRSKRIILNVGYPSTGRGVNVRSRCGSKGRVCRTNRHFRRQRQVISARCCLTGQVPSSCSAPGPRSHQGIPAASATAEKAARWAWCREAGRSPEDIRIQRSDYWPWLCRQPWFSEQAPLADQYPKIIEKLFGVRKQRRDFFERLIAPGVGPKSGYRALVRILNEGWINTVLTTNFDHCIEEAKVLENKPHFLVSIKTPDDLVRFNAASPDPQLVYLHGSVEHYSDKNLDHEVDQLDAPIVQRLVPLLRDHPLIVVGYRGNEPSVMKGLLLEQIKATNTFAQGVYWCVRESDMGQPLSPLVNELAAAIPIFRSSPSPASMSYFSTIFGIACVPKVHSRYGAAMPTAKPICPLTCELSRRPMLTISTTRCCVSA